MPGALSPVLARDVGILVNKLKEPEALPRISIPERILAWDAIESNNIPLAIQSVIDIVSRGIDAHTSRLARELLRQGWDRKLADAIVSQIINGPNPQMSPGEVNNFVVTGFLMKQFEFSKRIIEAGEREVQRMNQITREFFVINKGQLHLHLNQEIPHDIQHEIHAIATKTKYPLSEFGAKICMGDHEGAVDSLLMNAVEGVIQGESLDTISKWPISTFLPNAELQRLRLGTRPIIREQEVETSASVTDGSTARVTVSARQRRSKK